MGPSPVRGKFFLPGGAYGNQGGGDLTGTFLRSIFVSGP